MVGRSFEKIEKNFVWGNIGRRPLFGGIGVLHYPILVILNIIRIIKVGPNFYIIILAIKRAEK